MKNMNSLTMDSKDDISLEFANLNITRKRCANETVESLSKDLEDCTFTQRSPVTLPPRARTKPPSATQEKRKKTEPVFVVGLDFTSILFPTPKADLLRYLEAAKRVVKSNCCSNISWNYRQITSASSYQSRWQCVLSLSWPYDMRFRGEGSNKGHASSDAAAAALHWLYCNNLISESGAPILNDLPKNGQVMKETVYDISIERKYLYSIKKLIDTYKSGICKIVSEIIDSVGSECTDNPVTDPAVVSIKKEDTPETTLCANGKPKVKDEFAKVNGESPVMLKLQGESANARNEELYESYCIRPVESHSVVHGALGTVRTLPIMACRSELCFTVQCNQVVIVSGEPGSGKSTKVPQFVMDDWASRRRGVECNIVVSEPDDSLAISLAERVSYERNEVIGDVVGYETSKKSVSPRWRGGTITFCSSNALLHKIKKYPKLVGVSFVIVDEAQRLDMDNEILLALLKKALFLNPSLKLILLSTTLNLNNLEKYFCGSATVIIPDSVHYVKSYYSDDVSVQLKQKFTFFNPVTLAVDCENVAKFIAWLHRDRPEGAILCFLPSRAEINTVFEVLRKKLDSSDSFVLITDPFTLCKEQAQLFNVAPPKKRKIILTIDVCETAITINDVQYVVDTGLIRQERWDIVQEKSISRNHWISLQSVHQRKSRAGLFAPGEMYHLYPEYEYVLCVESKCESGYRVSHCTHTKINDIQYPQVLHVPLERVILYSKLFCKDEKSVDFLSKLPTPVNQYIVNQVKELQEMDLLTSEELLTHLGQQVAYLNIHPRLAIPLLFSSVVRCVKPVIVISAMLGNNIDLFESSAFPKVFRDIKMAINPISDHLALKSLYEDWENMTYISKAEANTFCFLKHLSPTALNLTKSMAKDLAKCLQSLKMMKRYDLYERLWSDVNEYSSNDELVKGVLLLGWDRIMTLSSSFSPMKSKTDKLFDRHIALVTGTRLIKCGPRRKIVDRSTQASSLILSINGVNSTFVGGETTVYAMYFEESQARKNADVCCRVEETTVVSPLTIILFKRGAVTKSVVYGKEDCVLLDVAGVRLTCKESDAQMVLDLREMLQNVLKCLLLTKGSHIHEKNHKIVKSFCDNLLPVVANLLHDSKLLNHYTDVYRDLDEET